MNVLAIEASTEACSVAVYRAGQIWEEHVLAPREHTQRLLAMVERLLQAATLELAQLDGIAFGRGPGAFTGVRVAASVTQGLAFGADLPVVPVSSLAALAHGAPEVDGAPGVLAAMDARMGEIYWAGFQRRGEDLVPLFQEQVGAPEALPLPREGAWVGVGSGWRVYGQALLPRCGPWLRAVEAAALPRASDVAKLALPMLVRGEVCAPEMALPIYLRDDVVQSPR